MSGGYGMTDKEVMLRAAMAELKALRAEWRVRDVHRGDAVYIERLARIADRVTQAMSADNHAWPETVQ